MLNSIEQAREHISARDKIKNFCSKFDKYNLVENEEGFVAEILDATDNQQAVYVFDTKGAIIAYDGYKETLNRIINVFGESQIIFTNNKEVSDSPKNKTKNIISNREGNA